MEIRTKLLKRGARSTTHVAKVETRHGNAIQFHGTKFQKKYVMVKDLPAYQLSQSTEIATTPVLGPCHRWPAVGATVWPVPTSLSPWQTAAGFRTCRLCNVSHKSSYCRISYHYHVTDLNGVQSRKFTCLQPQL